MPFPLLLLAAGLAHTSWTAMLQRFVTPQARVNYAGLAKEGLPVLDVYLATLAQSWPVSMTPQEHKAALINAYNALTVRWITTAYPVASVWRTRHPFTEARHTVNGRKYSLDQIETELRNLGDPRIHAVLVCAARSCPPLRREAYVAEKLDAQLDGNTRTWLANTALNNFDPTRREAEVSQIFEWYAADFTRSGGVPAFLAMYGPPYAVFLRETGKIRYRAYYWGLNDSGSAGDAYPTALLYFDYARNKYF